MCVCVCQQRGPFFSIVFTSSFELLENKKDDAHPQVLFLAQGVVLVLGLNLVICHFFKWRHGIVVLFLAGGGGWGATYGTGDMASSTCWVFVAYPSPQPVHKDAYMNNQKFKGGEPTIVRFLCPPFWSVAKPQIDYNGASGTVPGLETPWAGKRGSLQAAYTGLL